MEAGRARRRRGGDVCRRGRPNTHLRSVSMLLQVASHFLQVVSASVHPKDSSLVARVALSRRWRRAALASPLLPSLPLFVPCDFVCVCFLLYAQVDASSWRMWRMRRGKDRGRSSAIQSSRSAAAAAASLLATPRGSQSRGKQQRGQGSEQQGSNSVNSNHQQPHTASLFRPPTIALLASPIKRHEERNPHRRVCADDHAGSRQLQCECERSRCDRLGGARSELRGHATESVEPCELQVKDEESSSFTGAHASALLCLVLAPSSALVSLQLNSRRPLDRLPPRPLSLHHRRWPKWTKRSSACRATCSTWKKKSDQKSWLGRSQ